MVFEMIGEKSADKAFEAYAPFRPGDITVASSTPKVKNRLARRNASFFDDGSDDEEEEVSVWIYGFGFRIGFWI